MSLIDLVCKESIYVTQEGCYCAKDRKHLLLGEACWNQYVSYLFFSLPRYSGIGCLKQARLILFKVPQEDQASSCSSGVRVAYYVGPLIDFFSIYSYHYGSLTIERNQIVTFQDNVCCSYTEIDITSIVRNWLEDKIENKGILLYASRAASLITYASSRYSIESMRPRIRLIYEDNNGDPILSSVPCSVTIK